LEPGRLIRPRVQFQCWLAASVSACAAASVSGQGMLCAGVMSGVAYVAFPVSRLVPLEMVELFGSAIGKRPTVAVTRIKTVVDVAVEAARAVEPRSGSDKYAAQKPIGPVVAVRGAVIGGVVEVAVGAHGGYPNVYAKGNLGLRPVRAAQERSCEKNKCKYSNA